MKQAQPMQTVESFAGELLVAAYLANGEVSGQFNQFVLVARPGMRRKDVMKPFDDGQRASYFGRLP